MPTLNDVYTKFGFASEVAQLLETEIGNMLLWAGAIDANLLESPDPLRATELLNVINRQTLGQLLKKLNLPADASAEMEGLLKRALAERNRLAHSFYRQHNFRRNSEGGREAMLADLESIHVTLLDAYRAVLRTSGVDLETVPAGAFPTGHVPI